MIPPDHDAAGNIVYDGTYIYQYDAWSRLVQVNLAAQPPPGGGPAVGDAVPGTTQLAGPLVKHFTYDGLGRLVRVLSPYPEPGATPPEGWTVAPVRSERLYYDGVRRIQEVYTDPLLALGESAALGDPEAQGEVSQGGEEEGQTLEGEEGQIEQGSGEPGGEDPPGPPPNTFITYLEREYLWGPGDGITSGAGAGLDELIGIFDIDRRAWWTLLDASGDVVAVVDDSDSTLHGYGTGSPTTSQARLCAQFCYDAYGSLLTVQGLHPFPDPRTGHKGLHLDRFDAGVADPLTGAAIARHEGGAEHAYFVRNRHYSPECGRFLQRDPNGTAVATALVMSSRRAGLSPGAVSFGLTSHLQDGPAVYGAWVGNPLGFADPHGLGVIGGTVDVYFTIAFDAGDILHLLSSEYSMNQESDVDWAGDWGIADDWHTRGDSSWVQGVYEMVDPMGSVDSWIVDKIDPPGVLDLIFKNGPADYYVPGNKVFRQATHIGRVLDGAAHHAFFRIYTRLFKGVAKEIMVRIPKAVHREYHSLVDQRVSALVGHDMPSIWDPRGAKHWKDWAERNPQTVAKIPGALKQATAEFEAKHKIKGLSSALQEAFT